jgi:hypothetical protein
MDEKTLADLTAQLGEAYALVGKAKFAIDGTKQPEVWGNLDRAYLCLQKAAQTLHVLK